MRIVGLVFLMLATVVSSSWGQTRKPRTLDELATYTGADRHQILLEGAKAEGKIVWYTSLSGVYREMVDAFKRKYPDIAVEVYRGGSTDLGPRLVNEAQAGRFVADALESTPGLLMLLRERGLLKAYASPELAAIPMKQRQSRWHAGLLGDRSRGVFGIWLQHSFDRTGGGAEKFSGSIETGAQRQTRGDDRKLDQPGDRHHDQSKRRGVREAPARARRCACSKHRARVFSI